MIRQPARVVQLGEPVIPVGLERVHAAAPVGGARGLQRTQPQRGAAACGVHIAHYRDSRENFFENLFF